MSKIDFLKKQILAETVLAYPSIRLRGDMKGFENYDSWRLDYPYDDQDKKCDTCERVECRCETEDSMYTKEERKLIEAKATEIFKSMKVSCNLGGCHHHSGHEICSMDDAWESARNRAVEELFEQEEVL